MMFAMQAATPEQKNVCHDKERMIGRLARRALKENRPDDAREEVIRERWDVYENETYPVLRCYPDELVAEVNAVGSPASVLQHVLEIITPVQNEHFNNPLSGKPIAKAS